MKENVFSCKEVINIKGQLLDLSSPVVMGILNITPDSFSDGGAYETVDEAVEQARKLLSAGAGIIDVGGYSTRPGAAEVSVEEEVKRVVPVIKAIKAAMPDAIISIDTFRAEVARQAIEAGASMINDVSGGEADPEMFATVAALQVPYVLMHMRGTPQTMRDMTQYDDILLEMLDYFQEKITTLYALGVKDIIIDPGFGFAKTIGQNYELLRNLNYFKVLNLPVLVGVSRKSMIYKKLSIAVEEAGNGTTVLNTVAILNGAALLRVHDVKEAVQTIKLLKLVKG